MRAGDLVGITRASIGVPAGTLGLILSSHISVGDGGEKIYTVQLVGNKAVHAAVGRARRYLARDLEIVK
jgi:hypothetical protein